MRTRSRLTDGLGIRLTAFLGMALGVLAAALDARGQDQTPSAGEVLYKQQCGYCHGVSGEGTLEEYPHALAGRRSLESLTKYVAKTMPADNPETLSEEESLSVSTYIYEAFYSEEAQEKNTPRIELSRLTVRQYQNAAADLVGSFRWRGKWDQERGLNGQYYKSSRFRSNDRVLERRDPIINFDWGTQTPDDEKINPKEFSAQWTGSIRAPETGDFEFVVRTDHATRLYVNDMRTPIIDAWVKSGNDTEFRGSIRLMAGRVVPIRLEFSKATQGVQDQKFKDKVPMQPASMTLLWKPPHRAEEVVPTHCLSPHEWPESFVVSAPFPPDDRSMGYERGTSISEAWQLATTDGAVETTAYVLKNLRELAQVRENASDREVKLREFCGKFAERAFRRPLTDEQKALYIESAFQSTSDLDTAVKRVVLLVMKSPRFLYREIGGANDGYDAASRLSFAMWDSIPNEELLKAAAEGKLDGRDAIKEQAWRMVDDLRTQAKMREFLMQWLKVDQIPELAKDPALFPGFDEELASDLRTSLDLFLEDVVWGSEGSDYRRLLISDELFLNGRLAKEYEADVADDAGFQKVKVKKGERAGVLTHPYLMSYFAYTGTSSPIHRGVFLARNVLGRALRPPPIAVAPLAPDLHEGLTTRERVQLQTSPEACMSCHGLINSLGFTLENFDPLGRYREEEKGKAVDSSGWYVDRLEEEQEFTGVKDLAEYVSESEESQGTFVEQLFHYMVKQPIRAFGFEMPTTLKESFASEECNIKRLIVRIATEAAVGPVKPSA